MTDVCIETCKTFGPVQNVHENTWFMPKRPCNCSLTWSLEGHLVLFKRSRLRKRSWVQIAQNVDLYFQFIGLTQKNTIVFYWSYNCVVAILPIITLLVSAD